MQQRTSEMLLVFFTTNHGEKKLYFVLETKGSTLQEDLRPTEGAKIRCGKAHFAALGEKAQFMPIDDFSDFMHEI